MPDFIEVHDYMTLQVGVAPEVGPVIFWGVTWSPRPPHGLHHWLQPVGERIICVQERFMLLTTDTWPLLAVQLKLDL